jgi:Sulfotransferase domain
MALIPRSPGFLGAVILALVIAGCNIQLQALVSWHGEGSRTSDERERVTKATETILNNRDPRRNPAVRRRDRLHHSHAYWPPLSQLIRIANSTSRADGEEEGDVDIIGDVQHMLDFVIAGHPKTGTTSLMRWLSTHPQVMINPREVQSNLKVGEPSYLVRRLHRMYQPPANGNSTTTVVRGYKAPNEIHFRTGLRVLAKHWPNVKLVVGVRHPVHWFHSWYNFQVNNHQEMPPPELYNRNLDLPPILRFHDNLSLLCKTSLTDVERSLIGDRPSRIMSKEREDDILKRVGLDPNERTPVPNRVFLYDVAQADSSSDPIVAAQFRDDLSSFLGISPIPDSRRVNKMTRHRFDVCEVRFAPLRRRLVSLGGDMAEWILTYFLHHPDVTVSSPESFEAMLRSWSVDPCDQGHERQSTGA